VLRDYVISTRLAGDVATGSHHVLDNCRKMANGDPDHTFGLSDWSVTDIDDVRASLVAACGERAVTADPAGPGWIDPDAVVAAVQRQGQRLAAHARRRSRVLLGTGHPTGLLPHYIEVARALHACGCRILAPLDDRWVVEGDPPRGLRFFAGVACLRTGGDLLHTHEPHYMEAMLATLEEEGHEPDLVVGDHGMAGAAVERGIETLAIADVNDPALFLAEARGKPATVLPIDDNLAPRLYEPVTRAMLAPLG
jgi:hypothetical protein